jgi:hypothetical protein
MESFISFNTNSKVSKIGKLSHKLGKEWIKDCDNFNTILEQAPEAKRDLLGEVI